MSLATMAARPKSVKITPEGGSEYVLLDCTELEPVIDPEIIEDESFDDQLSFFYQGKKVYGFKFTTGDLALQNTISQGGFFSTASIEMSGVVKADGTQQVSGVVGLIVITNGVVLKMGQPKVSSGDGKPKRFEVELRVGHNSEGVAGSITPTYTTT
jgi:hypothetical protein